MSSPFLNNSRWEHRGWLGTELVRLAEPESVSSSVAVTLTLPRAELAMIFHEIMRVEPNTGRVYEALRRGELRLDDMDIERDGGAHFAFTAIFVPKEVE